MIANSHLGKILMLIGDGEKVELVPYIVFTSCICCCSVAKSCLTFCDLMDCSTPSFSVPPLLLGWCRSNHGLCVDICHLILEHILNKCGYVIHHFNVHFSLYVFLLMTLLAAYFIFILDYGNDVRQRANLSDFLWASSKWVVKQCIALETSTMLLAKELLTNIQSNGGSRSFAKETRALKMKSIVTRHWKLTRTSWEPSSKLILLQLHEKLLNNSTSTVVWSFSIWSKLERWKSLISGCFMS